MKALIRRYNKIIRKKPEKFENISKALIQARLPITTQRFLALSLIYAIFAGIVGSILGYLIFTYVIPFSHVYYVVFYNYLYVEFAPHLLTLAYIIYPPIGALIFGVIAFKLTHYLLLSYPFFLVNKRRNEINLYLPHAVNMMYGMAIGGVHIYDIFKSIAESEHIFGELSREFKIIINLIELDHNPIDSMRYVRDTTPSDKLASFLDDLIYILSGGGRLAEFLKSKSESHLEEQKDSFKSYIEFLGVMAEVYLAIFILLPLFLLIILVAMQLIGENILNMYKVGLILTLPIATVMFIYLIKSSLPIPTVRTEDIKILHKPIAFILPIEAKTFKIDKFKKLIKTGKKILLYPFEEKLHTLEFRALTIHFILIGIIVSVISFRFLSSIEETLIVTASSIMVPLIVLIELRERIIRKIEERIPVIFRELSLLNEAGLNIIEALRVLSASELGVIGREISIIRREIEWGTAVSRAFTILMRIKSDIIAKIVPVVVKALETSPTFKDAFMTVAKYADSEVNLKRTIRSSMFIYVVIIYMSMFIFLIVVYVVITSILTFGVNNTTSTIGTVMINLRVVKETFFQVCMMVGLLSGIVAGVIGEGKVIAGLKHSYIFLMAIYVIFKFLII